MLNRPQIVERLRAGNLIIDPLVEDSQIGSGSFELRLSPQFREFVSRAAAKGDADIGVGMSRIRDAVARAVGGPRKAIGWGDEIVLRRGRGIIAVTAEYVRIPGDLQGCVFPLAGLTRLGLNQAPSILHPGFQGRITLAIHNLGSASISLRTGTRIAEVAFSEVASSSSGDDARSVPEELSKVRRVFSERIANSEDHPPSSEHFRDLVASLTNASDRDKGRILEKVVRDLFLGITGIKIVKANARLASEEIDLIIQNDNGSGFWQHLGSPIIVECKNWSRKIGAREISVVFENLESLSPDAKTAILVAPNGISGTHYRDALLKIREKRQRGRYLLRLDIADLQELSTGTLVTELLDKKYGELFLI
ncbi:MAG: restriction endonuclease [Candidatus Sulfotelmatobacter sp.]